MYVLSTYGSMHKHTRMHYSNDVRMQNIQNDFRGFLSHHFELCLGDFLAPNCISLILLKEQNSEKKKTVAPTV